jgi:hypothetical protein
VSQPTSNAVSSTTYERRILFCGFAIVALAVLAGIFMSFQEWDRGSPFEVSHWGKYNPLGRATYGTLAFALVLFPVTLPALLVLSVPIYFGLKKPRRWPLALLGFLGLASLWLTCVIGVLNFD